MIREARENTSSGPQMSSICASVNPIIAIRRVGEEIIAASCGLRAVSATPFSPRILPVDERASGQRIAIGLEDGGGQTTFCRDDLSRPVHPKLVDGIQVAAQGGFVADVHQHVAAGVHHEAIRPGRIRSEHVTRYFFSTLIVAGKDRKSTRLNS